MNIRCFGYCFILAMVWAFDASAQPRIDDDPFDARYTIRGIEPSDYLGFGDYANEVLSLALPQTSNANDKENTHVGLSGFTVTTTAALHFWEVRRLRVRTRLSFPGAESTEIHLTWPTNVHVLEETFPSKQYVKHSSDQISVQILQSGFLSAIDCGPIPHPWRPKLRQIGYLT